MTFIVIVAGVEGTLARSSGTYTFTRSIPGTAVPVAAATLVSTIAQRAFQGAVFLMPWGQNDGTTDATTIIRRQRATVKRLRAFTKRWLVIGLASGTNASRAAMDAQFGSRFLNIRTYLSSTAALTAAGITPTDEDLAAVAAGSLPPSFWVSPTDSIHMNAAAYRRYARGVYEKLRSGGTTSGARSGTTPTRLSVLSSSKTTSRSDRLVRASSPPTLRLGKRHGSGPGAVLPPSRRTGVWASPALRRSSSRS